MSRTVLALAVMFSLCGGSGAAVPSPPFGQQPSSGKPDLSGRWVLNQAASDDAREKLQGVVGGRAGGGGGRPGGRGGGGAGGRVGGAGGRAGGAGGRAGGFGGRSDAGQAGEMRDTLRGLAIAPPLLIIAQRESEVTITGADGHAQVLRPDGRKVKEKLPAGGDLERVTKWTGGTLVTETKSRAGLKITQAYSRGDGPSLLVTLRLEIPRVGRPVQIRRMYDVATAAEVAATPPPAVRMGSEASTGNQALRQLGVAADPESVFKAMSGGRDTVGKEQFRKYLSERLAGRPIAERPEALDRLFDRLDADKNGSLTLVEFKALGTLLGGGRITGTATARPIPVPPPAASGPTFAAGGAVSQLNEREWTIDGVTRKALIYTPVTVDKVASPVVFAFHGHGGTMRNAAEKFAIHKHWPEAICIYMQGLPTPGMTDPEGMKPGWQKTAGDQKDRDLRFFDEVLAAVKKDYRVDETRVYVTGHSNGGGFTYLLWAARGDLFAAVAPSAAGAARNLGNLKPKPALHIAGELDETVPFENQKRTMGAVRRLNGCDAAGTPWAKAGALVGTLYSSKAGTPFVSVIYPGTHTFPDEAPELIVRFFKEHAGK